MKLSAIQLLLVAACFLIISLTFCHAYSSVVDQEDEEEDLRQPFINYDRRGGNWCARWGDYCVPHSRVRFASCCNDLRCVCGSLLWKPGQCQCRKPSMFGWHCVTRQNRQIRDTHTQRYVDICSQSSSHVHAHIHAHVQTHRHTISKCFMIFC